MAKNRKSGAPRKQQQIHAAPRTIVIDVECKCPACGIIHFVKASPPYPKTRPWIYCDKHYDRRFYSEY